MSRGGCAAAVLWMLMAPAAAAGPTGTRSIETPWPAVLPCERFERVELEPSGDTVDVAWVGAGKPIVATGVRETHRLALGRSFTPRALTRVEVRGLASSASDRVTIDILC